MTKIFSFWRVVISIAWAKSLTWAVTTKHEQKIFLLSLHIIKRDNSNALSLIIGPLSITVGYLTKEIKC